VYDSVRTSQGTVFFRQTDQPVRHQLFTVTDIQT